jgi:hypothetical protein
MAERTGIRLGSYRRLERGNLKNPPLRWIINCAIVLDCHWSDIWEPNWNEWLELDGVASPTDAQRELWGSLSRLWPEPSSDLTGLSGRPAAYSPAS